MESKVPSGAIAVAESSSGEEHIERMSPHSDRMRYIGKLARSSNSGAGKIDLGHCEKSNLKFSLKSKHDRAQDSYQSSYLKDNSNLRGYMSQENGGAIISFETKVEPDNSFTRNEKVESSTSPKLHHNDASSPVNETPLGYANIHPYDQEEAQFYQGQMQRIHSYGAHLNMESLNEYQNYGTNGDFCGIAENQPHDQKSESGSEVSKSSEASFSSRSLSNENNTFQFKQEGCLSEGEGLHIVEKELGHCQANFSHKDPYRHLEQPQESPDPQHVSGVITYPSMRINDPRILIPHMPNSIANMADPMNLSMTMDGYHQPCQQSVYSLPPASLYGYPTPMGAVPGGNMHQAHYAGVRASNSRNTTSMRYHIETNTTSPISEEPLPTFLNASAAPSRLPAHKPVRLTHPRHPLAPSGTPVYFKYGEEHYPEDTIPKEYTFREADGTVCRYITNFLVYNKRGERLLPIEGLDQRRHAALVLYGSLLPATAVSESISRVKRENPQDSGNIKKKRASSSTTGGTVKKHAGAQGATSSGSLNKEFTNRKKENYREKSGNGVVTQSYPVRVELVEWCIDYGQEPSNIPFIWLISSFDIYYRLEKPAGRYVQTFSSAKMKFEVSTRIIKTLQHRPDTGYKILVDWLTAATRHEKHQRKAEKKAQLKRKRRIQKQLIKKRSNSKGDSDVDLDDEDKLGGVVSPEETSEESAARTLVIVKKKTRNSRIHSLSTPQGTGVLLPDECGRPQALTPWGAPYAVEGFRESMLLSLAEFLESQLQNFMEGVGVAEGGACPNLLATPFMRVLRERTAMMMETMHLLEEKNRQLEIARSMIDPNQGTNQALPQNNGNLRMKSVPYLNAEMSQYGFPPLTQRSLRPDMAALVPYLPPDATSSAMFYNSNNAQLFGMSGMMPAPRRSIAARNVAALENEIHHLARLLENSNEDVDDDDDDEDEDDDDDDNDNDEEDDENDNENNDNNDDKNNDDNETDLNNEEDSDNRSQDNVEESNSETDENGGKGANVSEKQSNFKKYTNSSNTGVADNGTVAFSIRLSDSDNQNLDHLPEAQSYNDFFLSEKQTSIHCQGKQKPEYAVTAESDTSESEKKKNYSNSVSSQLSISGSKKKSLLPHPSTARQSISISLPEENNYVFESSSDTSPNSVTKTHNEICLKNKTVFFDVKGIKGTIWKYSINSDAKWKETNSSFGESSSSRITNGKQLYHMNTISFGTSSQLGSDLIKTSTSENNAKFYVHYVKNEHHYPKNSCSLASQGAENKIRDFLMSTDSSQTPKSFIGAGDKNALTSETVSNSTNKARCSVKSGLVPKSEKMADENKNSTNCLVPNVDITIGAEVYKTIKLDVQKNKKERRGSSICLEIKIRCKRKMEFSKISVENNGSRISRRSIVSQRLIDGKKLKLKVQSSSNFIDNSSAVFPWLFENVVKGLVFPVADLKVNQIFVPSGFTYATAISTIGSLCH